LPASQIRRQPVGNLDELVSQHLRLKVIDLDHKRHRVVLSQRLVLEEELQAKKQELLDTLEVGQIRSGVVVRLADFGAFVDLGGIDGLIHNSELSYSRIKHPSEVVKIGDVVQVEIMKFDPEAKKVSLSLKHALPDPWDQFADRLYETNKLTAAIVKVTPNYMLVEVIPGILAMVPKGEFDATAQFVAGQEVEVTLRFDQSCNAPDHGLDPARRRRTARGNRKVRGRGRDRRNRNGGAGASGAAFRAIASRRAGWLDRRHRSGGRARSPRSSASLALSSSIPMPLREKSSLRKAMDS